MPVYEYRCTRCDDETEVIVLPHEQAPTRCAACRGKLERKWGRVGVQLVGWGFAKTDRLVAEGPNRKSYKQLRDKASELFD